MKRNHRNLVVWEQAVELVAEIYSLTSSFPKSEQFGLESQLRRAAVSVPTNIAEGAARKGSKEYLYFISVASGSLSEVDTRLTIAQRLGFLENSIEIVGRVARTAGLLMEFAAAIRRKNATD